MPKIISSEKFALLDLRYNESSQFDNNIDYKLMIHSIRAGEITVTMAGMSNKMSALELSEADIQENFLDTTFRNHSVDLIQSVIYLVLK